MTSTRAETAPGDAAAMIGRLPHGPEFRFVTSAERVEPGVSAEGSWMVRGDEPFLAAHFPGDPIVPGVLLAESLAQVAGIAGFAATDDGASARLAHVDVKFPAAARPPGEVRLSARLMRSMGPLRLFEVRATFNDVVVAAGTVTLASEERVV